jgi:RNA-splicing ligase RtcB
MKIKTFGPVDARSLEQLERCMEAGDADFGVLCADHHPGYSQPIGGAVAYEGYISPSGCGYDIGCGNKAALTDLRRADLDALGGVEQVMGEITRRISFGVGVPAQERVDHPVLDKIRTADFAAQRKLAQLAESQLGTVGSGNHYVNLMADEDDRVWVGVHFGSRGFGHRTASGFLAMAQGLPFDGKAHEGEMDSPPVLFEIDSELGESYVAAMELAGEYAYAGRDVVVDKVLEILGAKAEHEVHNHHNFCIGADQNVQTPRGYCRMDRLMPADTVFAFDPARGLVETRVVDVWHSGSKPIYSIATDSRRIRCSFEHPILTVEVHEAAHPDRPWHSKRSGELVWKNAGEIRSGDVIVCAQAPCAYGSRIGSGEARFVGAFLGDGWVRSHPLPQGYSSSKRAYERVHALGLGGRVDEERVPRYAFTLPDEEKRSLLAGYFDADGSVAGESTGNHGRGAIASTNGALVAGLRELAVRAGLRVTPVRSETRTTNFGTCRVHRCVVAASSMGELDLWHERKRSRTRQMRKPPGLSLSAIGYVDLPPATFAQRVRKVEIRDEEAVYDLEVEHESHSFVCEGIVVHNCWREEHHGRTYWVVRKGCTPARPGQQGFVGGSMGDESVILEGVESATNEEALYSTVHGAGRVMSRSQAAGRVRRRKRFVCRNRDCDRLTDGGPCPEHPDAGVMKTWVTEQVKPGAVDWPAVQERLRTQGIVLVGGGADEAPEVYKRLPEVLAAHAGTIRVKHTLRPLGVAMAGRDVHDPYKD